MINEQYEKWLSGCPLKAYRTTEDKRNFFEAGQQSRQEEIDKLQKRVKELELINFDSELHFDAAKEHIDLLQKRIDLALDHTTNHGGYDDLTHIINILKGTT